MNEQQYQAICEACDSVLLSPKSTIERIAIAWLHVINEHPSVLDLYSDLFDKRRTEHFLGIKSALLQTRHRLKPQRVHLPLPVVPERVDVIFISHLLNESQAAAGEDFYFGRMPETLRDKGLSSLVVLRNHTGMDPHALAQKRPPDLAPRLILPDALCWREESAIRKRLRREAHSLREEARQSATSLKKKVFERAAKHALSSFSLASLRLCEQISRLVERLRPKAVVLTYEGHAWERLAFAASRRIITGVRCIGYHHTIIFPHMHSARRPLGPKFDPDTILTAGDITRDIFARSEGLKGVRVATLGIHRREERPGVSEKSKSLRTEIPTCLVIPDGTMTECLFLLKFALDAAAEMPAIRFIIRMHPVLPFASVAKRYPRLQNLSPNIEVSNKLIADDFARCRWALYRGSNASIYAVIAGLRPLYVARRGEMSLDPLHTIPDWRFIVQTATEFANLINLDLQSDPGTIEAKAQVAGELCRKYFMPINIEELYTALQSESSIE